MSGRTNQNTGVVEQLLGGVRYAVQAKDGSLIPCVEYTKFQVIHAELPGILLRLRTKQVANLTSKFQDGWRYAHGNDQDHLPEFTVMALNGQGNRSQSATTTCACWMARPWKSRSSSSSRNTMSA